MDAPFPRTETPCRVLQTDNESAEDDYGCPAPVLLDLDENKQRHGDHRGTLEGPDRFAGELVESDGTWGCFLPKLR
ncbi:uncharacterized protein LOC111674004 isoform X1 [Orussus abietinus]|uniref:uncharacterized protein LOC111674004 isoform X1 n=1 Tax=Orussus abietinus TaxID=222816 RepID=UPI000C715E44|nr:uncharacterized protein LOC111674004 isoform X1 [Orussus abietinus]